MTHPSVPPRDRLKWAAVDLDGTLAKPIWTASNPTSEIGEPIEENFVKAQALIDAGFKVVIHTARPDTDYERIESYFDYYGLKIRDIRTGKPLAGAYIDDRGVSADHSDWLAEMRRLTHD